MGLDTFDVITIREETKEICVRLDSLYSIMHMILDEQRRTNILLEKIDLNTHRDILGRDYEMFTSGDD